MTSFAPDAGLPGFRINDARNISTVGLDWDIAGTGDFDGDRKCDVLWRNHYSGAVSRWQMNGFEVAVAPSISTVGLEWTIAGVGVFNGDGNADVLWRNATDGTVGLWQMSGPLIIAAPNIAMSGSIARSLAPPT